MISREETHRILYGDFSPEEKPRYSLARAASYLKLSPSTLRSWVRGRTYPKGGKLEVWPPLIQADRLLSFNNLIEAYVLRALRVDHGIKMAAVREALDYVFIDRFGELINLNKSGQLAAKELLKAVLKRVQWSPAGLPVKVFPSVSFDVETLRRAPQYVMIDPAVSFGRPVLVNRGIRTSVIVGRIDAGEHPDDVANDFGLKREELDAAIFYERAAA